MGSTSKRLDERNNLSTAPPGHSGTANSPPLETAIVVVEYLLIVTRADSFCDSAEAFTSLLNVDSSVEIHGGAARCNNDFSCQYAVTSGEIVGKTQRFFHVRFSSNDCGTEEKLEKFSAFLKNIRSVMSRVGGQPETLWDDISFHFARNAYRLIYRVENLMRKLIANFMLVTVGAEWVDESIPREVKEALGRSKRKEYLNILHQIDFIHLADFLLRPYSSAATEDIYKLLQSAQTVEDLGHIKLLVPQSNWTRYFSRLVDCDDGFLKKRWEELYELRCRVAHNAIVHKTDFDRVAVLVCELEGKLEDAIKKLPQVQVPYAEVEQVAVNAAGSTSDLMWQFIESWKMLEAVLMSEAANQGLPPMSIRHTVDALLESRAIRNKDRGHLVRLIELRNYVIHPSNTVISEAELSDAIKVIDALVNKISSEDLD